MLITPAAEALQSLVGTNTFSTRNFAASWPFLALSVAALITCGGRRLRIVAAALRRRRRRPRCRADDQDR